MIAPPDRRTVTESAATGRAGRLALLALSALLAACAPDSEPAPVPNAGHGPIGGPSGTELAARQLLRRANGPEPETLDPHRAEGVSAANILRDLFEGLISESADGRLIPGVAERWTTSADGRTWTFFLRETARWSNGDRVSAGDFVFSLRRSVDPKTLSNYSAILNPVKNAAPIIAGRLPPEALGVRAVDERTLEIELEAPTPYLLGLLTHASTYPVHPPSVREHGDRFARPGRLVSNGAYQLAEWRMQSHVHLVRNPHYWDDASTVVDEVTFVTIESQEAELNRYRANELDLTYSIPARQLGWLRRNLPDELRIAPYLGSYVFGYNVTRPPFRDNPALRQALSLAIDREIIANRIAGAGEIPAWTWVPPMPGYPGAAPDYASWSQRQRNELARQLYREAGYSPERPLRVRLMYNTDANHRRITTAMAAMWREVLGVQTELVNQEWQVFLQTRKERYETEIFRYGWIGDYQDPYTFMEILRSDSGMNDMGYASPAYDRLLDEAAREPDPARRMALLAEAERIMLTDAPMIPIYFYVSKQLVKPWVAGFEGNIMDRHPTRHLRILKH